LHVDLDVLDPSEATANQWTPPGGISIELLLQAVTEVCKHVRVAALGVASYDPTMDQNKRALATARAVVKTVLTCDPGVK